MTHRSFLAVLLLLACTLRADLEQRFQLDVRQWTDKPRTVHVAGSFNGWNSTAFALAENDGLFIGMLSIPEGEYLYKLVLDAGMPSQKWIEDPSADPELRIPDGHGGFNSGLVVGPGAAKFPPPEPGDVNIDAVVFDPASPLDFNVIDEKSVRFRIRTLADDVTSVVVSLLPVEREPGSQVKLHRISRERGLDVWGGVVGFPSRLAGYTINITDSSPRSDATGRANIVVTPDGTKHTPAQIAEIRVDASDLRSPVLVTPDWARDAVWYQIFPERFRNGDPSNDPGDLGWERLIPWTHDWWQDAPGETPPDATHDNFYHGTGDVWNRRYGGDLAGVREKLPYLRELGVNAIYFNPVFEAQSMHKYDTADFRHVDDNFGAKDPIESTSNPQQHAPGSQTPGLSEATTRIPYHVVPQKLYELDGTPVDPGHVETEDPSTWKWTKSDLIFLQFLRDAREQGFKVVIDGVFNHVGRAHPFFQDVVEKGPASRFADWFEIESFADVHPADPAQFGKEGGLKFKAWDGPSGWLPAFRKSAEKGLAPGPYEHIMAITRRWLDPDGDPQTHDGIDGWRLDVPGDIPHPFWVDWRKVVKAANPDAYITGEIWTPAQPWINAGDQFDAVMNYQFAMASVDFFVDQQTAKTPSAYLRRLGQLVWMYPHQASLVMQNLYDSHDTDRVASMLVNPDRRNYDDENRPQDNARQRGYDKRKPTPEEYDRLLQMIAVQHTFLGAPMLYYGTEAGMWSPDDPSNRQPLPWDDKGPYADAAVAFDHDLFARVQRLVAVRNALPALRRGDFWPVLADDDAGTVVFARRHERQTVYVVINRSSAARTVTFDVEGESFVDYADPASVEVVMPMIEIATKRPVPVVRDGAKRHTPTEGKLAVDLSAWGVAILVSENP